MALPATLNTANMYAPRDFTPQKYTKERKRDILLQKLHAHNANHDV